MQTHSCSFLQSFFDNNALHAHCAVNVSSFTLHVTSMSNWGFALVHYLLYSYSQVVFDDMSHMPQVA